MPLADYTHKKRTVAFDGGEFEVRAISLPDVAGLVARNEEAIDHVVAVLRVQQELNLTDAQAVFDILFRLIRESPFLAADLITSCADEPSQFDAAFRLPLTVQVEALQTIADLTFADAAALKKFAADVKRLLTGILPPTAVAAA